MKLTRGLSEAYRQSAAELYWDAFSGKLGKLLGPKSRGIAYFTDIMQSENAICAMSDDGKNLLGLAGFDLGEGGIIGGGFSELRKHYGIFGGAWRALLLSVFERKPQEGILQMDGIVVSSNARGMGIGTQLLESVCTLARENGFGAVTLDVIDTNPKAKALYERRGFEVIKAEYIGGLHHLFGFRHAFKMVKRLEEN